jgi:hypothetical protein
MTARDHDDRETEALLAEIRSLEPPTGIDPPWEQMARDIRAACRAEDARKARGIVTRIRGYLHPRHIVVGAVAAVAGVALFVLIRGGDGTHNDVPTPVASLAAADAGAGERPPDANAPPVSLRTAALAELDDDELSALAEALRDPTSFIGEEDEEPVVPEETLLDPDVIAEAELPDDDEQAVGYEHLLDELSDTDMDKLDALLTRQEPG